VRVILERRRAEEQDVTAERGNRRHRAPGGFTGMAGRAPEPLRLVHDEEIDPRRDGLRRQLGIGRQRFEGHHCPAVQLERIEPGAEVAPHVGEPPLVEQREHLVILAPQFAQPLHRQRIGRDDKAAPDLPGVHEVVQNQ
jgi:hypothetical protein